MSVQNTKASNKQVAPKNQAVSKKPVDPRAEAVDRGFDALTRYCESDPITAKRIGGSLLIGTAIGMGVGGTIMIASTF